MKLTTILYFPNHIRHENSPNFSIVFIKYATNVDNDGLATMLEKAKSQGQKDCNFKQQIQAEI